MSAQERTIAVIGTGVVGSSAAYHLSQNSHYTVLALDKNNHTVRGENQSSRNSGVNHAGVYYDPEIMPIKAKYCVLGNAKLYTFGRQHGVRVKRTGKYVVASEEYEIPYLEEVLRVARLNDVQGVEMVSRSVLQENEPNVEGVAAVWVPTSGIVEPTELVYHLQRLAANNGAHFQGNHELLGIEQKIDGTYILRVNVRGTTQEYEEIHAVVNCAGVYADHVARMMNPESTCEVIAIRGESAMVNAYKSQILRVGRNIYPAPLGFWLQNIPRIGARKGEPARVPFGEYKKLLEQGIVERTVGKHFTPQFGRGDELSDMISFGPYHVLNIEKENTSKDLKAPEEYFSDGKKLLPGLREEDLGLYQAGNLVKLTGTSEWLIEHDPRSHTFWNVLGIDSPGLTASLPLGRYIAECVKRSLGE